MLNAAYVNPVGTACVSAGGDGVGVLDCDGAPVPGAVATLAASPAAGGAGAIDFIPGAEVYYFVSNLPVRRNQRVETNDDGQFVLLEAPIVTPAFVQVWGYPSDGAVGTGLDGLVLVAQHPVELFADAITFLDALPTEGPLP